MSAACALVLPGCGAPFTSHQTGKYPDRPHNGPDHPVMSLSEPCALRPPLHKAWNTQPLPCSVVTVTTTTACHTKVETFFMTLIHRIDKALFGFVSIVAQALLWLAIAAGFFQVISRFVLHSPLDWSEVLTRSAIIWAVMLGVALAFRQGSMIAVEFLREKLQGTAKRVLEGLVTLVCLGFLVFLTWIGGQMVYRVRFQSLAGLEVSISWVYLAIPVGAGLAAIALLLRWLTPDAPESQAPVRNDAQG